MKLTISPSDSETADIEGFFVQARSADSVDSAPLGQFVEIDAQHRAVDCGGDTAVSTAGWYRRTGWIAGRAITRRLLPCSLGHDQGL